VVCFVAYNFFAARLRTVIGETEQAVTRLINVLSIDAQSLPGEVATPQRGSTRAQEGPQHAVPAKS